MIMNERITGTLRLRRRGTEAPVASSEPPVTCSPTQAPIVANSGPAASGEATPEPKRRTIAELTAILSAAYPKLFDPAAPLPLVIGIAQPLRQAVGFSHSEIKRVLGIWCQRRPYLEALARSSLRHDLEGNVTYITAAQQVFAKSRLEQR